MAGFVHRIMPPVDWYCGDIPDTCYDKDKSKRDIEQELTKSYLSEANINRLVEFLKNQDEWRDNQNVRVAAEMQLQILAEIDADTIWDWNLVRDWDKQ